MRRRICSIISVKTSNAVPGALQERQNGEISRLLSRFAESRARFLPRRSDEPNEGNRYIGLDLSRRLASLGAARDVRVFPPQDKSTTT